MSEMVECKVIKNTETKEYASVLDGAIFWNTHAIESTLYTREKELQDDFEAITKAYPELALKIVSINVMLLEREEE